MTDLHYTLSFWAYANSILSINILWFLLQQKSFETSKNGNKIKDKTASEKSECLVLRNAVKNPEMISLLRDRTRNFDK